MAINKFRRTLSAFVLGLGCVALAGCATTGTSTTATPTVTTTVTTGVTNLVTDVTPVLPSNVQSVVTKIQSVISSTCSFVPTTTSLINLVNTNATVTTVGDIANMVCSAYNNATAGKVSARRFGGPIPLTVLVDGIPVTGKVITK